MEAFSWEAMGMANLCGFVAIVVLPWAAHFMNKREEKASGNTGRSLFFFTMIMWLVAPFVGILFAADTPGATPLWVGQSVMAFLLLYVTGAVMGFISLLVFIIIYAMREPEQSEGLSNP